MLDVSEKEDLMITCESGITIRMAVNKISELGRATQGVKLIRVDEGDSIAAITQLDEQEEELDEILETATEQNEVSSETETQDDSAESTAIESEDPEDSPEA